MPATVLSATVHGLDGLPVAVEIDLQRGLRSFQIVGLPSLAVRESRERVAAALANCGHEMPDKHLTVNLAPADLPKEGAGFDLAIALGVLAASGQCPLRRLEGTCILGELGLQGSIRQVRGVLPIAIAMHARGIRRVVVPLANAAEARLVPGLEVVACTDLRQVVEWARGQATTQATGAQRASAPCDPRTAQASDARTGGADRPDFAQVFGQETAKRALAIAAAGGHHVLLTGPPGVGKSMLARCMPGLLPPLAPGEALEVRQVFSVCGRHDVAAAPDVQRPFRAPHHSVSIAGLAGGGRPLVPGEITLAHHGVLFLDELPEFPRHLLDFLRQPLEEGAIFLARANHTVRYPARFQLIAAMNPCTCGFLGHPKKPCRCTPKDIARYRSRISGPILDRIDLRVEVQIPPAEHIGFVGDVADTQRLRIRIAEARARQVDRYAHVDGVHCNAQTGPQERRTLIRPRREAEALLRRAMTRWSLSVRAYERTLSVARSIADIDGASDVDPQHVAEALQYRLPTS